MTEENQPEQQPPSAEIDWSSDSVRLLGNGERVKCMVIMDVTTLSEEEQHLFVSRALVALTRMGEKIINRKNKQN